MTDLESVEALAKRLEGGAIERPKRWSGDTHDDLGGSVDCDATDAMMAEAATALRAQAAEIERLRSERSKLLHEISPPEDWPLVSAVRALKNCAEKAESAARTAYARGIQAAHDALVVVPAASIEQEQMAQRCQAAIRALAPDPSRAG